MRHRRRMVVLFVACAAAVFGAMSWLTYALRQLERRQAEMNARAESDYGFQTSIRTALWRMESRLAAFLAQESARPYFHYSAFYSPDAAYTDALTTMACKGDVIEPSPLLSVEPEFCRLHFQIDGDGLLSSPRVPSDPLKRNEAQHRYVSAAEIASAESLLAELSRLVTPGELRFFAESLPSSLENADSQTAWTPPAESATRRPSAQVLAQQELVQRQQTAQAALNVKQTYSAWAPTAEVQPSFGPLKAKWQTRPAAGGGRGGVELLLLRKVQIGSEWLVQGIWVDWEALRASLLARIQEELPGSDLVPGSYTDQRPEQLAGIPAFLEPDQSQLPIMPAEPAVRQEIYIAWASAAVAIIALGAALLAIIELGERRGRFVSAVTHELRTPLTTFCLYSQMLADGMVKDEAAKREYVETLKRESQRLARIVENVLCYARLAGVRSTLHRESMDAGELLDRLTPPLARRATEAGMELVADTAGVRGRVIKADAQTIERVLTNLVDNACKYGGPANGGAVPIRLVAQAVPGCVEVRIEDNGPGIPRSQRRRVFRAFSRTTEARESSAPGLGLGLSLARGLAQEMGGDLRVVPTPQGQGAVLALSIPCRVVEPAGEAGPGSRRTKGEGRSIATDGPKLGNPAQTGLAAR